jgi:hypothetical protein
MEPKPYVPPSPQHAGISADADQPSVKILRESEEIWECTFGPLLCAALNRKASVAKVFETTAMLEGPKAIQFPLID